ncbi:MAG: hypothetical protein RLZZ450_68 [Pseudomonadota bacterium]|jgi:hypothetical protein
MPCSGGGPSPSEINEDLRAELKLVQGYLCDLCTVVTNAKLKLPKPISQWYDAHEAAELPRLRREALAKLSERDKRVLGILK